MNEYKGLLVGFARVDITPEASVPLCGYGVSEHRMSSNVLDRLQSTCIAFREDGETILLYTNDLLFSDPFATPVYREAVSEATGVEEEQILVCATHTHSGPDQESKLPVITDYKAFLKAQMVKAALAALADLTPAKLYGASTELHGMNFVRHYKMNDGTYFGSNFGSTESGYQGHAAENDPQMRLVKIHREGAKDILMMSWAAHPCFTGGTVRPDISADYIANVREEMESRTDMHFAFFQAAAGNQNTNSMIQAERHALDREGYGKCLADTAISLLPAMKEIGGKGIRATRVKLDYPINHDGEDKLEEAKKVVDLWQTTGDREQGNALAKEYGFASVYEASAVLGHPKRPAMGFMRLYATAIGDFAFVNAPCEMFAATGRYIKEHSPFEMTMVFSCSNSALGYYPTVDAYEYGCFESQISYFARGCAELTQTKCVELLNSLK